MTTINSIKEKLKAKKEAERANQFPRKPQLGDKRINKDGIPEIYCKVAKENENERASKERTVGTISETDGLSESVPKPVRERKRKISFKRTKQDV